MKCERVFFSAESIRPSQVVIGQAELDRLQHDKLCQRFLFIFRTFFKDGSDSDFFLCLICSIIPEQKGRFEGIRLCFLRKSKQHRFHLVFLCFSLELQKLPPERHREPSGSLGVWSGPRLSSFSACKVSRLISVAKVTTGSGKCE